jgi:hypothetical protein
VDDIPVEMDEVLESGLLFFLSKRKDMDVIGQVVFSLKETDNVHRLAILSTFGHPAMKKAENWVVFVEFLRGYE